MARTKDFNILFQKVITGSPKKDLAVVTNYNMYVQQIQNVCNTQKGEHLNHNFGCNLFQYLFDRQGNQHLIETIVSSSIENNIPSLTNVKTSMVYADDTLIRFSIEFYIRDGIKTQNANCLIEVNT